MMPFCLQTCEQYWTIEPCGEKHGPFIIETTAEIKSDPSITIRDFTISNTEMVSVNHFKTGLPKKKPTTKMFTFVKFPNLFHMENSKTSGHTFISTVC